MKRFGFFSNTLMFHDMEEKKLILEQQQQQQQPWAIIVMEIFKFCVQCIATEFKLLGRRRKILANFCYISTI
ncbi:hypothetical protein DERF_008436 [Dermatophagoides farinae]|uniref:Uncharacterized protein n=1 Tax=Dermatophagoides farinae TaxID=6954 RepID=A0A922I0C8_DERFA|nr:hypothetical protein DERF_008436 [Dermatophagoides farinae]